MSDAPEKAQALLDEMEAVEIRKMWEVPWDFTMDLARAYIERDAEITRLRAPLDDWRASQHYRYIGADGKPVKARDLEDEVIRLRAKVEAADKLAEVYWRLRRYAVHDDDCTRNLHPHWLGCSCGLKDALDNGEATTRVFQPVPAAPTEYETKLAQLKKDFPNGI